LATARSSVPVFNSWRPSKLVLVPPSALDQRLPGPHLMTA
jgi:hypothetical protein